MRRSKQFKWALGIFGVWLAWAALSGWPGLWQIFRQAHWAMLGGWVLAALGLWMLAVSRPPEWRKMVWAMVVVVVGLGLMWLPSDGLGMLKSLRVGFDGAALACLPRVWRDVRRWEQRQIR